MLGFFALIFCNVILMETFFGGKNMLLSSVVKGLKFKKIKGGLNKTICSVTYDSRKVVKDSLFVAIQGFIFDGHDYVSQAIQNGANTIIVEKDFSIENSDVTVLKVTDSRDALAKISTNFYHNPTEGMNLVGITGTNGKTSISYFLKSIFEQNNKMTGVIGTNGTVFNNQSFKNDNTTPESSNLQEIFSEMLKFKVDTSIMEVSSHSLELKRVAYCKFNTAIFTNLSPDHLELHGDMESYFQAKAKLFDLTSDYNVINIDDTYGARLVNKLKSNNKKVLTYGVENDADIFASEMELNEGYSVYTLNTPNKETMKIKVNMPGMIYVYNSLASIACAYCNDISLLDIKKGIENVKNIRGRLEVVYQEKDYKVIVDFAHTADSLEKALKTLRSFTKGKLIVVFGVYAPPGNIGKDKRKSMGEVAAKYADFSVVTSDNPKSQDPALIIKEVGQAIKEAGGNFIGIVDRKKAIEYALEMSGKSDTVLLAGKGHETSQVIGDKEIPFDERRIVKGYMEAMKTQSIPVD